MDWDAIFDGYALRYSDMTRDTRKRVAYPFPSFALPLERLLLSIKTSYHLSNGNRVSSIQGEPEQLVGRRGLREL